MDVTKKNIKDIREEINKLNEDYANGSITLDEYTKENTRLVDKLNEYRETLKNQFVAQDEAKKEMKEY
jgi:predicted  nucleic acid-binding Zn-ribbon protein